MDDQSVSQNPGYLEKDVSISFSGDKIRCFFILFVCFLELWKNFHPFSWEVRPNPSMILVTETGSLS